MGAFADGLAIHLDGSFVVIDQDYQFSLLTQSPQRLDWIREVQDVQDLTTFDFYRSIMVVGGNKASMGQL
ncbi:hypothetical protein D3C80_1951690 [compost metagenome]